MVRQSSLWKSIVFCLTILLFSITALSTPTHAAPEAKQRVFDDAGLLTKEEVAELEALSAKYSEKRETDFIILTSKDADGKDIEDFMGDTYDEKEFGYDKPKGNAVMLTMDMSERDVMVTGFGEGERLLDNNRANLVREKITPALSRGDYFDAFSQYIKSSYKYMGYREGVDPDNIFFSTLFQLAISVGLGVVVVGKMLYNSGGKVTVSGRTYSDANKSRVVQRRDVYVRTSVTKRRKPKNNSSGGSRGGGGGVTRGGSSYSGSRGKF